MAVAQVIGRYALGEALASGGMATVHLGRLLGPVGFSRTVAIKRLHKEFARDPEFVAMFLDEARLAARIHHPNVVQTLDVVTTHGELFLVMEYVLGESVGWLLRNCKARGAQVPPRIVSGIVTGALYGLHAAHEAVDEYGRGLDIVHRDISPQNVMVGADGIARVLDFGVAKAVGRMQTTREGQVKGKLAYMAPEQVTSDRVTRRTDVYATSVLLWETFTAERLFKGETEAVTLARILAGDVIPPSKIIPGLPTAVDDVILKGLARNPNDRFATARDMAVALDKALTAAPPPEIADWLKATASHSLGERAARVANIERESAKDHTTPASSQAALAAAQMESHDPISSTWLGVGPQQPPTGPLVVPTPIVAIQPTEDPNTRSAVSIPSLTVVRPPRTPYGLLVALAGVLLAIGVTGIVLAHRTGAMRAANASESAAPTAPEPTASTPLPSAVAAATTSAPVTAPKVDEPPPPSASTKVRAGTTARPVPKPVSSNPFDALGGREAAPLPPPVKKGGAFDNLGGRQ